MCVLRRHILVAELVRGCPRPGSRGSRRACNVPGAYLKSREKRCDVVAVFLPISFWRDLDDIQ